MYMCVGMDLSLYMCVRGVDLPLYMCVRGVDLTLYMCARGVDLPLYMCVRGMICLFICVLGLYVSASLYVC